MAEAPLILRWMILFVAANAVYVPFVEEKELEKRFGGDYRTFRSNVPRWVPRPTPWRGTTR